MKLSGEQLFFPTSECDCSTAYSLNISNVIKPVNSCTARVDPSPLQILPSAAQILKPVSTYDEYSIASSTASEIFM